MCEKELRKAETAVQERGINIKKTMMMLNGGSFNEMMMDDNDNAVPGEIYPGLFFLWGSISHKIL